MDHSRAPVILIAEDDEIFRMVLCEHLRNIGFVVLEAVNAANALDLLRVNQPVDLVVTDVTMPGEMNGCEMADWLSEHRPSLPVIITSGLTKCPSTLRARRRFLAKPYPLACLECEIEELLPSIQTHSCACIPLLSIITPPRH